MSKVEVDPRGWPDYTYPMTIIGQELNVAIDIAAQSLPTLDINIAACAVTLNINIESISEGVVFNVAQSGDWTINAVQTGTWTINIGAPLDASGYLQTHIMDSVQLDVNIAASSVTLNVNIVESAVTLNVNIESISEGVTFNVAQSGTWTINAVQTGTWTINIGAPLDAEGNVETSIVKSVQLDVNIAASAVTLNVNIASSAVTLNVKITDSTATLDVLIIGQSTTLNIRITDSIVTLNVNIAGQTANVNIDIKAQSVAIKGLTDWAAETATDIDITGFGICDSGLTYTIVSYTVPSGKTLLIYNWDAALSNGDGQIYCNLHNSSTGADLGFGGGTRGFSAVLGKPVRVASGHTVKIFVRQDTGASRDVFAHFGGVLL